MSGSGFRARGDSPSGSLYNRAGMSHESSPDPKSAAKSWQARIGEPNDKLAQAFVESISYDRRLYKHDIAGSIAHATMLAKVGLITDAEREAIEQGLNSIEKDIEADNFKFDISNRQNGRPAMAARFCFPGGTSSTSSLTISFVSFAPLCG